MVDPSTSELTADQRFKQLAAILAVGVRRYRQRLQRSESSPKQVPEFSPNELEVPANLRLSGSRRIGI
jgi:hypothetical protein